MLRILLAAVAVVLVWSVIGCHDLFTWLRATPLQRGKARYGAVDGRAVRHTTA